MGVSCTNFSDKTQKTTVGDRAFPDMEIHTFFREFFVDEEKQMHVYATNFKLYTSDDEMELYNMFMDMFEDNIISTTARADKAIVHDKTLYTKLYTNVIIQASNGTVLYTEYIEWDNEERYFHTKEAVRIEQSDGSWLTGIGMEGDMKLENFIVYNEEDEGDLESFGSN